MSQNVYWIAGWACDWPQEFCRAIEAAIPSRTHHWIGYSQQVGMDWNLSLHADDTLVAWSLGAKRALENLEIHPQMQCIWYAPAWDFCHQELGWSARVIQRMQKLLGRNRPGVLEDFYQKVGLEPAESQEILAQVEGLELEVLSEGLSELTQALSEASWSRLTQLQGPQMVLSPEFDQLVSPSLLSSLQETRDFTNLVPIPKQSHHAAQGSLVSLYAQWIQ